MAALPVDQALINPPDLPGVYLIQDERHTIIYIGKAKSLKKRLRQHFSAESGKSSRIRKHARYIDIIVTKSEAEALVLENNLIKLHKPRFNTAWKDGKTYPLVEITTSESYPRVVITRSPENSQANLLLGPFPSMQSLRKTVDYAVRLFRVADCKKNIEELREKQARIRCMRLRTKSCLAPCVNIISPVEYQRRVKQLILFLKGEQTELLKELQRSMEEKAQSLAFEEAAEVRDQIQAIQRTLITQVVENLPIDDVDVIGIYRQGGAISAELMAIRNQKLWGGDTVYFHFRVSTPTTGEDQGATGKETQFHAQNLEPLEGMIEEETIGYLVLTEFYEKRGHQRGKVVMSKEYLPPSYPSGIHLLKRLEKTHKDLLQLAEYNARVEFNRYLQRGLTEDETENALEQLKELLDLPGLPRKIHGFDVSTLQGTNTVASCVAFLWGKPYTREYRRFRIKSPRAQQDDFRAIEEAVFRRYRTIARPASSSLDLEEEELPDLILIDGGPQQLEFARKALHRLQLDHLPLLSLAKKEELLCFLDRDPLSLPHSHPALRLLMAVRDEAHRFAITYHRHLRNKREIRSRLDSIKGLGPKRKQKLLEYFGGDITAIALASLEELQEVPGIPGRLARAIYLTFHPR